MKRIEQQETLFTDLSADRVTENTENESSYTLKSNLECRLAKFVSCDERQTQIFEESKEVKPLDTGVKLHEIQIVPSEGEPEQSKEVKAKALED